MIPAPTFAIELLDRSHNRNVFDCGITSLNRYLQHQANQDMRRGISRVFIARPSENKSRILGFYTLSAISIDLSVLPEKIARKLPKHPVPAALIGRLAVDLSAQGMGTGQLLADAIKRTIAVSDDIAIYTMVLDAINQLHTLANNIQHLGLDVDGIDFTLRHALRQSKSKVTGTGTNVSQNQHRV